MFTTSLIFDTSYGQRERRHNFDLDTQMQITSNFTPLGTSRTKHRCHELAALFRKRHSFTDKFCSKYIFFVYLCKCLLFPLWIYNSAPAAMVPSGPRLTGWFWLLKSELQTKHVFIRIMKVVRGTKCRRDFPRRCRRYYYIIMKWNTRRKGIDTWASDED